MITQQEIDNDQAGFIGFMFTHMTPGAKALTEKLFGNSDKQEFPMESYKMIFIDLSDEQNIQKRIT